MIKSERTFIYLNCLKFSGTVFQTQILDWLHLYEKHNVRFELIQVFRVNEIIKPHNIRRQVSDIARSTKLFSGFVFLFPARGVLSVLNAIILYLKLFKYVIRSKEILIFSRDLIGREIEFLRKITKCRIIFYYDARAASAEEKRYISFKQKIFSRSKFLAIANIHYLEYVTSSIADKIFSVSYVLRDYYINSFAVATDKFVYYPCLSDDRKFRYDLDIRKRIRDKLGIADDTLILIYSGGIKNEWHVGTRLFNFANEVTMRKRNSLFLILTRDQDIVKQAIQRYPDLDGRIISFSVPNDEVGDYLNASDLGILFRENTIMNNVASPTKFAEYMLCGLPVIISEGVGDYSQYTVNNAVGVLIKENELANPAKYDFMKIFERKFERQKISELGRQQFSKQSIIDRLIQEFRA